MDGTAVEARSDDHPPPVREGSDNVSFTVPVDRGAQWLHQGASNPLAATAVQAGHTTIPYAFPRVFYDGDRQLAADDPDVARISSLQSAQSA